MKTTIILLLLALGASAQTKEEVRKYIIQCGIKHPDIVYAQMCLETGHLTSTIYKENNNLFGLKVAKTRPTYAIGENRGHAVFRSWRYCVLEYRLWQDCYFKGGDYYSFLDRMGYATSKTYIRKLKQIKI